MSTKPLTPKMADALYKIQANGGRVGYGLEAFKALGINGQSVIALESRGLLEVTLDEKGDCLLVLTATGQSASQTAKEKQMSDDRHEKYGEAIWNNLPPRLENPEDIEAAIDAVMAEADMELDAEKFRAGAEWARLHTEIADLHRKLGIATERREHHWEELKHLREELKESRRRAMDSGTKLAWAMAQIEHMEQGEGDSDA